MKEKWMVSMKGSWIGDATTPHPPPPHDIKGKDSNVTRAKEVIAYLNKEMPDVPKPIGPLPPPKRVIKEDVSKEFLKGMVWAFLILILIHVGLAYVLL